MEATLNLRDSEMKLIARRLRAHFGEAGVALSHAQCLEAIAAGLGHRNWQTALASSRTYEQLVSDPKSLAEKERAELVAHFQSYEGDVFSFLRNVGMGVGLKTSEFTFEVVDSSNWGDGSFHVIYQAECNFRPDYPMYVTLTAWIELSGSTIDIKTDFTVENRTVNGVKVVDTFHAIASNKCAKLTLSDPKFRSKLGTLLECPDTVIFEALNEWDTQTNEWYASNMDFKGDNPDSNLEAMARKRWSGNTKR